LHPFCACTQPPPPPILTQPPSLTADQPLACW
jgi:hypothetical protein